MIRRQHIPASAVLLTLLTMLLASSGLRGQGQRSGQGQGQGQGRGQQQPARDTPAQRNSETVPAATGRIGGRVLAADNARPVRRARVMVNAPEIPGGRGILTDDNGLFEFTELPAGRYTLTVSKTGFINLSYGQRRPLMAGTPLQLADGQRLTGIEFRLPRGSVISGRIYDDAGEPMPGAMVQVMRYQYAQGNRQLVPAGGAQTDDQGAYRVWGLNPGDYYVSAVIRNVGRPGAAFGPGGAGGPPGGRGGRGFGGDVVTFGRSGGPGAPDEEPTGYAPTFYPGVASVNESRPVTVTLGAEMRDVDFSVLLVRTLRVSGQLVGPQGETLYSGTANLMPEAGQGGRMGPGRNFGARVQWDGTFEIANVPPGRYNLRARSDDTDPPIFGTFPVVVTDMDLTNLLVVLNHGATISGTVTFQSSQSATLPDVSQVRIAAPFTDFTNVGPNSAARVDREGVFTLDGVAAGSHWIRAQSAPRGWMLKSVVVGGRDVIDTPIELRSDQKLTGVTLTFTDKLSEINGTITDDRGTPVTEYTVLAFPSDTSLWRPQARQIATTRPDQNGKYQLRGLPPGEYLLTTVDPSEQGEWYEPAFLEQQRTGASRLILGDGDVKTQDFKVTP